MHVDKGIFTDILNPCPETFSRIRRYVYVLMFLCSLSVLRIVCELPNIDLVCKWEREGEGV